MDDFKIVKNGTLTVWSASVDLSTSIEEHSMCVMLDLEAGDNIEIMVDGGVDATLTSHPGCTLNIKQIA
jgi:hypothetical protein